MGSPRGSSITAQVLSVCLATSCGAARADDDGNPNAGELLIEAAVPATAYVEDTEAGRTPVRLRLGAGVYRVRVVYDEGGERSQRQVVLDGTTSRALFPRLLRHELAEKTRGLSLYVGAGGAFLGGDFYEAETGVAQADFGLSWGVASALEARAGLFAGGGPHLGLGGATCAIRMYAGTRYGAELGARVAYYSDQRAPGFWLVHASPVSIRIGAAREWEITPAGGVGMSFEPGLVLAGMLSFTRRIDL